MANATLQDLFGDDLLLSFDASDALSLWTDTAETTNANDGDTVLSWSPQSSSFSSESLQESTNGPVYRADYNAEGYPALEFTAGNSDVLCVDAADSPLSGTRRLVLAVFQWIASGTVFSLGNSGTGWSRYFQSGSGTSVAQMTMQSNVSGGTINPSDAVVPGRWATAFDFNQVRSKFDLGATSGGDDVSTLATSLSNQITLGALNAGSQSQWGSFALYEIAFISGANVDYGQLLRGKRVLEAKWGITSVGGVPQAESGSGGGGEVLHPLAGGVS